MNNIIPDVENQDDIQTINKINLKVLHDNETYKLKMNNNVLIWKIKEILQIHLNVTLSIIELLYNNTELLDDKLFCHTRLETIFNWKLNMTNENS